MAIKVFKTSDRIPVKIGDAVFYLAPMSQEQKLDLMTCMSKEGSSQIDNLTKTSFLVMKYTIKDVKGIEYADGSPYKLEMDDKGLTDACISELMNTEISINLILACQSFIKGVPKEILDPQTNEKLKDVEILALDNNKKK